VYANLSASVAVSRVIGVIGVIGGRERWDETPPRGRSGASDSGVSQDGADADG